MTFTMRDYYRNLRGGLCPQCGRDRDADGLLCQRCLEGNRRRGALVPDKLKKRYRREYRIRKRKAGLCPKCGKPPAPGRVHCRPCLDAEIRRRGNHVKIYCH